MPTRKIDSMVSVVEARVSTATIAHQDSTGICAASSRSTMSRRPGHLGLDAGKALHQRDIAQGVGGALGERGVVPSTVLCSCSVLRMTSAVSRPNTAADADQQRPPGAN